MMETVKPDDELEAAQESGKPEVVAAQHLMHASESIRLTANMAHCPDQKFDSIPEIPQIRVASDQFVDQFVRPRQQRLESEFPSDEDSETDHGLLLPGVRVTDIETRNEPGWFDAMLLESGAELPAKETPPADEDGESDMTPFPELPMQEICFVDGEPILFFRKNFSPKNVMDLFDCDDLCATFSTHDSRLEDMEGHLCIEGMDKIKELFYRDYYARYTTHGMMPDGTERPRSAVQEALYKIIEDFKLPGDGEWQSHSNVLYRFDARYPGGIFAIPPIAGEFKEAFRRFSAQDRSAENELLILDLQRLTAEADKLTARSAVATSELLLKKLEAIKTESLSLKASSHLGDAMSNAKQAAGLFKQHLQEVEASQRVRDLF